MRIFRAVKTNFISQGFGKENTMPSLLPLYQSFGLLGHNGLDFVAQDGEGIYFDCSGKGEVVAIHNDDPINEGIGVCIYTNDADGLYQHRYWHLKSVACKLGVIESGDLIGYADNTGHSTGVHLHRDLKPMSVNSNGVYYDTLQSNGYNGAIDITPFLDNRFVVDVKKNLEAQLNIVQKIINLILEFLKGRSK